MTDHTAKPPTGYIIVGFLFMESDHFVLLLFLKLLALVKVSCATVLAKRKKNSQKTQKDTRRHKTPL